MPKPRITESELAALLEREWADVVEDAQPPAHWKSILQLSEAWNTTHSVTYKRVRKQLEAGAVAMREFRIVRNGKRLPVPHYCPTTTLARLEPNHVRPQAQGPHSD